MGGWESSDMVAQLHLTQMHMVHKSLLELYYNKNVVVFVFRFCDFYHFLCAFYTFHNAETIHILNTFKTIIQTLGIIIDPTLGIRGPPHLMTYSSELLAP